MNARKHAWNNGAAANARGAVLERGSFARLFRSTQSNDIAHLQCKELLYSLPETPIPFHPPIPLLNISQNSSRTAGKRSFTVLH